MTNSLNVLAGGRLTGAEIGSIAEEMGLEVSLQALISLDDDEKYESEFEHILKFDTLTTANLSILAIDEVFQKYKAANDIVGHEQSQGSRPPRPTMVHGCFKEQKG